MNATWPWGAICLVCAILGVWLGMALAGSAARRRAMAAPLPASCPANDTDITAWVEQAVGRALHGDAAARATSEASLDQVRREGLQQLQTLARLQDQVNQALQCIPQRVQQAIQIELEFLSRQEDERDRGAKPRREFLAVWPANDVTSASVPALDTAVPVLRRPARAIPKAPSQISSARPPELLHTPLPRPTPVPEVCEPAPEFTDEELDALPPDLPATDRPRKRVLHAPGKPVLRSL